MGKPLRYTDAGVDIDKANALVERIKKIARTTHRPGVMGEIGGFGGLFSLNTANYEQPVLVSATDGVGTKLKVAFRMNKHDTVGVDLVAMCVNDIVVQGARPLFFLDYLSSGHLDPEVAAQVVTGIGEGCRQAKCVLIGGETAEMPGMHQPGEYDLAGFAVGIVDNSKIVDGSEIRGGHRLVGIASDGLHSNGFSLARKICFDSCRLDVGSYVPELSTTLGEELLRPTRIYSELVLNLVKDLPIHGLAHITGGGLTENIIRIIPEACGLVIDTAAWPVPPVFGWLQQAGGVSEAEMRRTFNMGIGMVAVVPERIAREVLERLHAMNEKAYSIGEVVAIKGKAPRVEFI